VPDKSCAGIASKVDVLIGNEEDLQTSLGIKGPDVVARKSALDTGTFFGMIEEAVKQFPNIKAVRPPCVKSIPRTAIHGARFYGLAASVTRHPVCELDVLDRIGGGDGFAAGLMYGLITGRKPEEALRLGWAHGAMLTTFPGDTSMATLEQVEAFAKGGGARVQTLTQNVVGPAMIYAKTDKTDPHAVQKYGLK